MAYEVEVTRSAAEELKRIRVYDRRRIVDDIRIHLTDQPLVVTRKRKTLNQAEASFEHVPPLWELRVDEYRVFYDVDTALFKVYVRAIRRKEADQTTEEVIQ